MPLGLVGSDLVFVVRLDLGVGSGLDGDGEEVVGVVSCIFPHPPQHITKPCTTIICVFHCKNLFYISKIIFVLFLKRLVASDSLKIKVVPFGLMG